MNDLPGALEPMHDLHVEEKVDDDDGALLHSCFALCLTYA